MPRSKTNSCRLPNLFFIGNYSNGHQKKMPSERKFKMIATYALPDSGTCRMPRWVRLRCPRMSFQCWSALALGALVGRRRFRLLVLAPHILTFPLDTRALHSLLPFVRCHHLQRARANNRELCFAWPTVGSGAPRRVATQRVDGVAHNSAWENETLHCKSRVEHFCLTVFLR